MKKNLESIVNVVLGTAGHIDHGKSTLVERLTGIHPDRLPEEQARGLTIDLGFSRLTLKSGLKVGIIDVPGHERLIKNMVAGATGIDIVLLVLAADDGVMPQTREHIAILQLLGLEHGIVVLTKIDLVGADMIELVKEDLREALNGTFLEAAPLVEVSSVTGEGIDRLLETIHQEVARVRPRDATGIFRMPIQRVFSAKGFGTVVTGVPLGGSVSPGQVLEIVPVGARGRVRGIHAYGEAVDMARAGHSSAINLSDVDYTAVHRGMVLTEPGYFRPSTLFEARFHHLPGNRRPLSQQTPIRLHVGTLETVGSMHLLEKKALAPGEDAFVQLRLDTPAVAAPGDRFIVRLQSPPETIGGGEIIDQSKWRLKTGKPLVIEGLRQKEEALGNPLDWVARALDAGGHAAVSERDVAVRAGLPIEEARSLLAALVERGDVVRAARPGLFLSNRMLESGEAHVLRAAEQHFRENPRRRFLEKPKLKQSLGYDDVFFQELLDRMATRELLFEEPGGRVRFRDHGPKLRPEDEEARAEILAAFAESLFTPPSPAEVSARTGRDRRRIDELFLLLEEEGEVVRLAEDVYLLRRAVEQGREKLREHLAAHRTMTASDAKNVLGSTRKYMIPLLEYFDREGFTVRRGDVRELRAPQTGT